MLKRSLTEKVGKISLYLKPSSAYWRATDFDEPVVIDHGLLGPYPLDLRPRLSDGHYNQFDSTGIPVRSASNGKPAYLITTMASYGLAQWHMYVKTGNDQYLQKMLVIADYLRLREKTGRELHLIDKSDSGHLSANNQAQAISLLVRAYIATKRDAYLGAAYACFRPFLRSVDEVGICGDLAQSQLVWYEESTTRPLHHILNGMIYAIWGIMDLHSVTGDSDVKDALNQGKASLRKGAAQFNLGWWSKYWIPDAGGVEYMASIMYQALHVAQLKATAKIFNEPQLDMIAQQFSGQLNNPICRGRSAVAFAMSKRKLIKYLSQANA